LYVASIYGTVTAVDFLINRVYNTSMEINSASLKYYEEHHLYLQKMRDKTLYENRVEQERHLQKLRVDNTQRARELDRNLGQNIDVTV
jgi:hypothetical protein